MAATALRVNGIGKQYRIGARQARPDQLRDRIAGAASAAFGRLLNRRRASAEETMIWALRDVSFDVRQGDVVGIIGGNGAGKSTLLKILSRITEPTEGTAEVRGRVGSLLEVGTGFHPELTGRENIFLNGAILGMRRAEIARKFDAIVAFAGVERFIDTAVKHYSSGMYVRLAFAVAAHMEPDLLIVDEVLAVGDVHFQKKCLGKMNEVSRQGRTILFVSHNLDAVQRLCSRGLLIDRGRVAADGPMGEVVTKYRAGDTCGEGLGVFNPASRRGRGWAEIADVRLMTPEGYRTGARAADQDLVFEIDLAARAGDGARLRGLVVELVISSDEGHPLCSVMNVDDEGVDLPDAAACTVRVRIPAPTFVPGVYRLRTFLGIPHLQHVDEIDDALQFEVMPPVQPWRPYELTAGRGHVCRRADWTTGVPA
ncbi:MAG: ABC transporter ATP-binding protein [Vicinamibacterales bacterium]